MKIQSNAEPSNVRKSLPHAIFSSLLLVLAASIASAQTGTPATPSPNTNATTDAAQAAPAQDAAQAKPVRNSDRRKAAKLFLAAGKLFEQQHYEEALQLYLRAAELDPGNRDYALAVEVDRSHLVTALVQDAAKDRLHDDPAGARAALARAQELDPKNPEVGQHLNELGTEALLGQIDPRYRRTAETAGEAETLAPAPDLRSFHLHTDRRGIMREVFKAYGIEVTIDDSVKYIMTRLDLDNVRFEEAVRVAELVTHSFHVTLDPHRALVAEDIKEKRDAFMRQDLETVYLSGLNEKELDEVAGLARNVFEIQQVVADHSAGTMTLRAPMNSLNAFNATMRLLLEGQSQVVLDVRVIQLAHTEQRNTGATLPQNVAAFNVYTEEQAILNANQSLVQQIISSGLAAPGDTLTIIGILLASGQVSSSLFSNGIALFGGGLTQSALSPGPVSFNLNLNSSDSRELDQIHLRLGDGEKTTLRSGSRYPIQTSSFSSIAASVPNIPGLTSAGASGSLTSLLSSLSSVPNIPQVEYQDLGLTLTATPKVLRSGDIALTLELKIDALSGSSIDGDPILNNRSYSGVVTLKEGETAAVVSELDRSESRAVSGTPGISEIPGLSNISNNNNQKNYSTLLIVMTPRVIRGPQAAGHSPMMRVEKNATGR